MSRIEQTLSNIIVEQAGLIRGRVRADMNEASIIYLRLEPEAATWTSVLTGLSTRSEPSSRLAGVVGWLHSELGASVSIHRLRRDDCAGPDSVEFPDIPIAVNADLSTDVDVLIDVRLASGEQLVQAFIRNRSSKFPPIALARFGIRVKGYGVFGATPDSDRGGRAEFAAFIESGALISAPNALAGMASISRGMPMDRDWVTIAKPEEMLIRTPWAYRYRTFQDVSDARAWWSAQFLRRLISICVNSEIPVRSREDRSVAIGVRNADEYPRRFAFVCHDPAVGPLMLQPDVATEDMDSKFDVRMLDPIGARMPSIDIRKRVGASAVLVERATGIRDPSGDFGRSHFGRAGLWDILLPSRVMTPPHVGEELAWCFVLYVAQSVGELASVKIVENVNGAWDMSNCRVRTVLKATPNVGFTWVSEFTLRDRNWSRRLAIVSSDACVVPTSFHNIRETFKHHRMAIETPR